ncbi:MAG: hypothetical protein NZ455_12475 [Bacteroidia bacterium]|nr:hypothetical protein [Bacteroidia bacterium]MDW8345890.1 hypothetical protein [Bacteroidia bacterium]
MKKKTKIILLTLIGLSFVFTAFLYRMTRTSKYLLPTEAVTIYENSLKTKTQNLETNLEQLNKRYFDNSLHAIPQWDNFTLMGAQMLKNNFQEPILLLWYNNNSYQSPLLTLVYQNKTLNRYVIKKYKKGSTEFITYKDYEMPIFTQGGCTYVAICAFNTQTHLHGAIDLNREKDWKNTLKSLQWIKVSV